jgi:hypothetical protein
MVKFIIAMPDGEELTIKGTETHSMQQGRKWITYFKTIKTFEELKNAVLSKLREPNRKNHEKLQKYLDETPQNILITYNDKLYDKLEFLPEAIAGIIEFKLRMIKPSTTGIGKLNIYKKRTKKNTKKKIKKNTKKNTKKKIKKNTKKNTKHIKNTNE